MSNDRSHRRRSRGRATFGVALIAVAGLAVAACGDDESSSESSAESSAGPSSSAPAAGVDTSTSDTASSDTTTPATVPATTPADTTTDTTAGAVPATTTDPPPLPMPALLRAIDGGGDAVLIESGSPTVRYDGTDPDEEAPSEGETISIDAVTTSGDGATMVVSLCCEPVAGSLLSIDLATGVEAYLGFGHLAMFGSDDTMYWTAYDATNSGAGDGVAASMIAPHDPTAGTVIDLAVVPGEPTEGDVLILLIATPDGTELHRHTASGGEPSLRATVSGATWTDAEQPSLAGYQTGAFYVLDEPNDQLLAFDSATLAVVPAELAPAGFDTFEWLSAWITPASVAYVTDDRALFVDGDQQIPGEYVWVR